MENRLGRYELLEEIGQGGFAIVHLARDTELDRLVALKELRPHLLNDNNWVKRFQREARTIARLDHPHIVPIYDVGEIEDPHPRSFIVMRWIQGPTLEKLLAEKGQLSWSETLTIIQAITSGLDYAHAQEILHRDLKPANILMDPKLGAMLSDFGLAKLTIEDSMSSTSSRSIVGTPYYIAPEVWEGHEATLQADVYALGCILYEMLIGEKMFKGSTPPAVMMAHFSPITLPQRWPEGIPPGTGAIIKQALSQSPANRYPTAGEMLNAIEALLTDSTVPMVNPEEVVETTDLPPATKIENQEKILKETDSPSSDSDSLSSDSDSPSSDSSPLAERGTERHHLPTELMSSSSPMAEPKRGWSCFWKGTIWMVLTVVTVLGLGWICSTLGTALLPDLTEVTNRAMDTFLPEVDVGPTLTEEFNVRSPSRTEVVNLEIYFNSGQFYLEPETKDGRLVGGLATYNVSQLKPIEFALDNTIRLEQSGGIGFNFLARDDIRNRWDLKLGMTPLNLLLNVGKSEGRIELGGLTLEQLDIHQNTSDLIWTFSDTNRVTMKQLNFEGNFGNTSMIGLGNAQTREMYFDLKNGRYILDFSGALQDDLIVVILASSNKDVIAASKDVVLIVPEGIRAELSVIGEPKVEQGDLWEQVDKQHFRLPGESSQPQIIFDIDMEAGSLVLRTSNSEQ